MTLSIERRADPSAVAALLDELPGWFGMPAANEAYVRDAALLPSYLAVDTGVVAGALLLKRHFPTAAEIHLLAVRPTLHRRGIGRALLAAAESDLRADGVRWLQVKTLSASHPSPEYALTRAFYAAVGFEPLEEIVGLWPGNPMLLQLKRLCVAP